MPVRIQVLDDHTGDELPDHTPDDVITVRLGERSWHAYLSEGSADKLEQTIREFLSGLEATTEPEPRPAAPKPTTKSKGKSSLASSSTAEDRQAQRERIRQFVENHASPDIRDQNIGERGRIPTTVLTAFYGAHPKERKLFG